MRENERENERERAILMTFGASMGDLTVNIIYLYAYRYIALPVGEFHSAES